MKKHRKTLTLLALVVAMAVSMSACLDPTALDSDWNFSLSGNFDFTDVTAGAFVLNNLSRTIEVTQISVEHNSYEGVLRLFANEPPPLTSKAVLVNASEDNYHFEITWQHPDGWGDNPLKRSLTMPASRLVREYYLFMTEDDEVVLVDSLEEVRRRDYNRGDTVLDITVIQRDPTIEIIAQQIFDARNSGWLTIRNGSSNNLSGITIMPASQQLVNSLTEIELEYITSWRPTLHRRNPVVQELPTTGIRLRIGDYIILYENVLIAEVSVQPEIATNYGSTNVVTIIDHPGNGNGNGNGNDCDCDACDDDCTCTPDDPCGDPKCDCNDDNKPDPNAPLNEIRAMMIRLPRFWSATSTVNPNVWTGINVNSVLSPAVILMGPGTIQQRQAIVDQSQAIDPFFFTHGTGVEVTSDGITQRSVRKTSNTDAWLQYRILASVAKTENDIVLRIEF